MPEIRIDRISEDTSKCVYQVQVVEERSHSTHTVTVPYDYHQKITGGKLSPEDLVIKSFRFLLQREPKEMILNKFDLPVISRYFPEYENEIMKE